MVIDLPFKKTSGMVLIHNQKVIESKKYLLMVENHQYFIGLRVNVNTSFPINSIKHLNNY
jgi:hypothetical protein